MFQVEAMQATASGSLQARLQIQNTNSAEEITSIALCCQIHIEPARRHYSAEEKAALVDLFGTPERWPTTVRPLPWGKTQTSVPAFHAATTVLLSLPCSFETKFAAPEFLACVREGEVPLNFLFSGTVVYRAPSGESQAAPISWNSEARYRLPVEIWKEASRVPASNFAEIHRREVDAFLKRAAERALRNTCETGAGQ
jgi:hypothetical protein